MKKRNFINSLLQHTRRPDGFLGRMMLRGMNNGHAPLTRWGAAHIEWQPQWCVLDIGCGGGATLLRLLERCPDGMVCGVDASPESVEFSRRKTARYADRCSVEQATADDLPYGDRAFNAVTAFETVYFWGDLHRAFAEVARVLKPGGVFLVCCEMSNPGNDTWTSRIEGMQVFSPEEPERRTGRQWIYGYRRLPARQGELLRNGMHSRRQTDCGGIKGRKYPHASIDRGSAVRRDPPYHTKAGRTNGTTSYCRIIHPATCSRNPPRQRRRAGKKTQRRGRPHLPGNTSISECFSPKSRGHPQAPPWHSRTRDTHSAPGSSARMGRAVTRPVRSSSARRVPASSGRSGV